MQTLLDKISIIDFKYEKLREQDGFNIFSILLNGHDEVNLHSRFLAELLNPRGSHNQGRVFLDSFLRLFNLNPQDYSSVEVTTERMKIDILIWGQQEVLIIENKIWAGDQERQLETYFSKVKDKGAKRVKVMYLTLDGRMPNEYTLGSLTKEPELDKMLLTTSYAKEIPEWLNLCIQTTSTLPTLRETIVQYKNLINDLTGNSMSEAERNDIADLLSENNNILSASKIVANWNYIRMRTEWNFWKELKEVIAIDYPEAVLELQQFTWKQIQDAVEGKRNTKPYYGIMINLKQSGDFKICLFIERGYHDVYYGITVIDKEGNKEITNTNKCDHLVKYIENKCTWEREPWWLGGRHLEPRINFGLFQNDATLKLAKSNDRKEYILECWTKVKEFIEACDLENYDFPIEYTYHSS